VSDLPLLYHPSKGVLFQISEESFIEEYPIVLYNCLGWERSEVIRITVKDTVAPVDAFLPHARVVDDAGNAIPAQVNGLVKGTCLLVGCCYCDCTCVMRFARTDLKNEKQSTFEVWFAVRLPALSLSTYFLSLWPDTADNVRVRGRRDDLLFVPAIVRVLVCHQLHMPASGDAFRVTSQYYQPPPSSSASSTPTPSPTRSPSVTRSPSKSRIPPSASPSTVTSTEPFEDVPSGPTKSPTSGTEMMGSFKLSQLNLTRAAVSAEPSPSADPKAPSDTEFSIVAAKLSRRNPIVKRKLLSVPVENDGIAFEFVSVPNRNIKLSTACVSISVDQSSGLILSMLRNASTSGAPRPNRYDRSSSGPSDDVIELGQHFSVYAGSKSGAYLFKPDVQATFPLRNGRASITVIDGPLVKSVHLQGDTWSQVVRLFEPSNPLQCQDMTQLFTSVHVEQTLAADSGHELVQRFGTSFPVGQLNNAEFPPAEVAARVNGSFYSDNSLELLKRKRPVE
jgi:hypothetical protein